MWVYGFQTYCVEANVRWQSWAKQRVFLICKCLEQESDQTCVTDSFSPIWLYITLVERERHQDKSSNAASGAAELNSFSPHSESQSARQGPKRNQKNQTRARIISGTP